MGYRMGFALGYVGGIALQVAIIVWLAEHGLGWLSCLVAIPLLLGAWNYIALRIADLVGTLFGFLLP